MLRVDIGLLFSRSGSYRLIAEACRAGALDHRTTLDIEGVTVGVTVEQGLNRVPDAFVVRPPPGFYALPPHGLQVQDSNKGVIEIFPGSTS